MTYIPRKDRDMARSRRAASAARQDGASAMDAALLSIGIAFNESATINRHKMMAEFAVKAGPGAIHVRGRYGPLAEHVGFSSDLSTAIRQLQTTIFNGEIKIRQQKRLGLPCNAGFSFARAREALIIMRWLRMKRLADYWPNILHVVETSLTDICPQVFVMVPSVRFPVREFA